MVNTVSRAFYHFWATAPGLRDTELALGGRYLNLGGHNRALRVLNFGLYFGGHDFFLFEVRMLAKKARVRVWEPKSLKGLDLRLGDHDHDLGLREQDLCLSQSL